MNDNMVYMYIVCVCIMYVLLCPAYCEWVCLTPIAWGSTLTVQDQQMATEPLPGSMGEMDGEQDFRGGGGGGGTASFEDEPPLLEELGIDFELIKLKVR